MINLVITRGLRFLKMGVKPVALKFFFLPSPGCLPGYIYNPPIQTLIQTRTHTHISNGTDSPLPPYDPMDLSIVQFENH